METNVINTNIKIFGQSIMIESTGIPEVDEAIKTIFKDDYRKGGELLITRDDVQIVLAWSRDEELATVVDGQLNLDF